MEADPGKKVILGANETPRFHLNFPIISNAKPMRITPPVAKACHHVRVTCFGAVGEGNSENVCVCVTICRPRKAQRDWIYFTAQSAIVMNPKFWLIGKRNKRIIFLIWKEILIQVLQDAFYGSAVHLGAALVYRSCKNCLAWGVCGDDKRECYFCYVLLITIFMLISGSKGSFD